MAKSKNKSPVKSQAARFMEVAKAAGATDKSFQRTMGKATLAKQSRRAGKGQVG